MEKDDAIGIQYGSTIGIPAAYGGGSINWGQIDASSLESVRNNMPPCQARAELETRLMIAERLDQLIHALVGVGGKDVVQTLSHIENDQHLALSKVLTPSIMRYLNDIARANAGIGIRMDHQDAVSRAVSEAVQQGGAVDYRQAAKASAGLDPARQKVSREDVAYINGERS
ncbi:hypothetical protein ACT3R7_12095 [Halomonas sp. AOP43-A1-21]